MTDSIVAIRMTRNLRYKLTYIRIFETYLESESNPDVVGLLKSLIEAQQAAIAPLSSFLRRLDVNIQDVALDEKLMGHALDRKDLKSRLRFIYEGMNRATSWYKTQLQDRHMTADPELEQLLFELGETDAAKLWRTEAVMTMLRIPVKAKVREWRDQPRQATAQEEGWRSRLIEDVRRPVWGDKRTQWPKPSKYRRKG